MSTTITVKLPVLLLPEESVPVQTTVVVPKGKMLPEGGSHDTKGEGSWSSVADAVNA